MTKRLMVAMLTVAAVMAIAVPAMADIGRPILPGAQAMGMKTLP